MFKTIKQVIVNSTTFNRPLPSKKIAIAVSVVAILGISYSVASWCTGNTLQSKLDKNLADMNQKVNLLSAYHLEFSYTDYEKGIFSSTTDLQIKRFDQKTQQLISTITLPITIYHGPLPWNRLSHGDLTPNMASIYYQMNEQVSPTLWQAANNQPFIKANIEVSYDESLDIELNNQALNYTDPTQSTSYQVSTGKTKIAIDTQNNIKYSGEIGKIEFINQTNRVVIDNLSWSGKNVANNQYNQQIDVGIKELQLNNSNIALQTHQLKLGINSQQKELYIALNSKLSVEDTFLGQQNIGKGQISFSYESLLDNLLDYLSDDIGENDPIGDDVTSNDNNRSVSLSLNEFLWQNQFGDITANLAVKLTDNNQPIAQLNQNNLAFLQTNINLPFKPLAYLLAQLKYADQHSITQSEIDEQYRYLQRLSSILLQNAKFIRSDFVADSQSGGLSMNLSYPENEDKTTINGQSMSKDKFWQTISQLY